MLLYAGARGVTRGRSRRTFADLLASAYQLFEGCGHGHRVLVEVGYPQWQPAVTVPAVMTPEQAVEAARALQARSLVPIHYNRTFEHPTYYRPLADARERIETLAALRGIEVGFLSRVNGLTPTSPPLTANSRSKRATANSG